MQPLYSAEAILSYGGVAPGAEAIFSYGGVAPGAEAIFSYGSVAEWLKAAVLKTAEHASVP